MDDSAFHLGYAGAEKEHARAILVFFPAATVHLF